MTRPNTWLRGMALAGVAVLSLTACGGGESSSQSSGESGSASASASASDESPPPRNEGDGTLTIGTLLPETGSLSFLGPPEIAGVQLAVQDINAAGGVLGQDVGLVEGDSGDTESGIAPQTVDRLLSQNADVIVGAASSSVSLSVIDKITGAGVVQISPANTSDEFTNYDDQGLYFRTAPPDTQQGTVLGQYIAEQGVTRLAILALQDAYGEGLANQVEQVFTDLGGEVTNKIIYDPKASSYDAEVSEVAAASPDGVLVIGFDESQKVIQAMVEAGIGPQDVPVFGVDGNVSGLGDLFGEQASVLEGLAGTQPQAELAGDFTSRLQEIDPSLTEFPYAGESYDAVIIAALAAIAAGTDTGTAIAQEINGITKDGEKCTSFEACKAILEGGGDVDYDGVIGPLEFTEAGEPAESSFAIYQYTGTADPEIVDYRFPE